MPARRRKRNRIAVNLSNCRYDVVRDCVTSNSWRIVEDESSDDPWNLYWTDTSVATERLIRMARYQKVNHFPGMLQVCRKASLARTLNRMARIFPKEYNFFPRSWVLPEDFTDFKAQFGAKVDHFGRTVRPKRNVTYIVKPDAGCQGKGIILTRTLANVPQNIACVAQKYIARPLLIDGRKFDMRLYVLVSSVAPLRIFLFQDGLVRLCSQEYSPPKASNLSNTRVHLTNYAINKLSTDGHDEKETNDDIDTELDEARPDKGVKRSMVWLRNWLIDQGHDFDALWRRIADMMVKLIIPAVPQLSHTYLSAIGDSSRASSGSHQRPCLPAKQVRHKHNSAEGSDFERDTSGRLLCPSQGPGSSAAHLYTRVGAASMRHGVAVGVTGVANQANEFVPLDIHSSCFEILGVDVLLDTKLKPWLIEVNHSPSFTCDSPLDKAIKTRLVREALALANLRSQDRSRHARHNSKAARSRLYGASKVVRQIRRSSRNHVRSRELSDDEDSGSESSTFSECAMSDIRATTSQVTAKPVTDTFVSEYELLKSRPKSRMQAVAIDQPTDFVKHVENVTGASTSATSSHTFVDGSDTDCETRVQRRWEQDSAILAERRQRVFEALSAPGFSRIYPPHDALDRHIADITNSRVTSRALESRLRHNARMERNSRSQSSTGSMSQYQTPLRETNSWRSKLKPKLPQKKLRQGVIGYSQVYGGDDMGGYMRCPGHSTAVQFPSISPLQKALEYTKILVASAHILDRGVGSCSNTSYSGSHTKGISGIHHESPLPEKLSALEESFQIQSCLSSCSSSRTSLVGQRENNSKELSENSCYSTSDDCSSRPLKNDNLKCEKNHDELPSQPLRKTISSRNVAFRSQDQSQSSRGKSSATTSHRTEIKPGTSSPWTKKSNSFSGHTREYQFSNVSDERVGRGDACVVETKGVPEQTSNTSRLTTFHLLRGLPTSHNSIPQQGINRLHKQRYAVRMTPVNIGNVSMISGSSATKSPEQKLKSQAWINANFSSTQTPVSPFTAPVQYTQYEPNIQKRDDVRSLRSSSRFTNSNYQSSRQNWSRPWRTNMKRTS